MLPIVCLDAGHGGRDPGATGNGLKEKDITLDIALRIEALILQRGGIKPVLTRRTDTDLLAGRSFVSTEDVRARGAVSNKAKADLMISVHVDATPGGYGGTAYVWAKGANAERAAKIIQSKVIAAADWYDRGIREANFMILRGANGVPGWPGVTDAPAVLFENGFIDNSNDSAKLARPEFRQKLAVAYADGIYEYFEVGYKKEEGGNDVLDHAVVYFTAKDFSSALMVADKLGGCATFCRNASATIHPDAKSAKHLVIVGGSQYTDHANVTNCCGLGAPETAILAAQYAQTL